MINETGEMKDETRIFFLRYSTNILKMTEQLNILGQNWAICMWAVVKKVRTTAAGDALQGRIVPDVVMDPFSGCVITFFSLHWLFCRLKPQMFLVSGRPLPPQAVIVC